MVNTTRRMKEIKSNSFNVANKSHRIMRIRLHNAKVFSARECVVAVLFFSIYFEASFNRV